MLNNEEAPMYDTTDTCLRDCGVHATVPTERTVSLKSRNDWKQLYNSEKNQCDRDTRSSTTFNGVVNAANRQIQQLLYQQNTDKRQGEPNTANDNDARVDVGDDRRFDPYSHQEARQGLRPSKHCRALRRVRPSQLVRKKP